MEFISQNTHWVALGLIAIVVIILLFSGYLKALPDKAYIISVLRKNPKVLIGRAVVKILFLERKN